MKYYIVVELIEKNNDYDYLNELSERLRNIPVMYGLDEYDVDTLKEIAQKIEQKDNITTKVKAYINSNYRDEINVLQVAQYFRERGYYVFKDPFQNPLECPYTIFAHITDNTETLQPIPNSPHLKLYAK